jgi:hypothetical protein
VLLSLLKYGKEIVLNYSHEAEWTTFQNHKFSENVAGRELNPGLVDL